ncbi:MAG TPA: TlpA disulfide reductase family protein [Candidatus Nitrosotalea sp.]|nr:TlpA disulfide reductase family protein [Candidatus Nitrosotalea sp.]
MNTSYRNFKTLTSVMLVAGSLVNPRCVAGNQIKVNDTFPELQKFELEGKVPDSLKGKVVLVDFCASWCAPCKASFPVMADLQKRYGDRGFVIIAVSVDEKRSAIDDFLKKNAVPFTVLRDVKQKLVEAASVASMPTSFLLDGEGRVRFIHNGFKGEETRKQYETEIEGLLKSGRPSVAGL